MPSSRHHNSVPYPCAFHRNVCFIVFMFVISCVEQSCTSRAKTLLHLCRVSFKCWFPACLELSRPLMDYTASLAGLYVLQSRTFTQLHHVPVLWAHSIVAACRRLHRHTCKAPGWVLGTCKLPRPPPLVTSFHATSQTCLHMTEGRHPVPWRPWVQAVHHVLA